MIPNKPKTIIKNHKEKTRKKEKEKIVLLKKKKKSDSPIKNQTFL
jgi:hypothetical protein